jgi:hypothetical protein
MKLKALIVVLVGSAIFAGVIYLKYGENQNAGDVVGSSASDQAPEISEASSMARAPDRNGVASSEAPIHAVPPIENVDRAFEESADYFELIAALAPSAIAGDSRSQLYIGLAIRRCSGVVGLFRTPHADPYQNLALFYSTRPKLPQAEYERSRSSIKECAGFFEDGALKAIFPESFAELSAGDWISRAASSGDALANAYAAKDVASRIAGYMSEPDLSAARTQLADMVNRATANADPRAIAKLGDVFGDSAVSKDTGVGTALQLAACDLGLDCSTGRYLPCVANGTCANVPADFRSFLQREMPSAEYQRVSRVAREIVASLQRGDSAPLKQLIADTRS